MQKFDFNLQIEVFLSICLPNHVFTFSHLYMKVGSSNFLEDRLVTLNFEAHFYTGIICLDMQLPLIINKNLKGNAFHHENFT